MVKNLPTVWETWVQSLDWEDPLEKGAATHSIILAWRIPWTEEMLIYHWYMVHCQAWSPLLTTSPISWKYFVERSWFLNHGFLCNIYTQTNVNKLISLYQGRRSVHGKILQLLWVFWLIMWAMNHPLPWNISSIVVLKYHLNVLLFSRFPCLYFSYQLNLSF